MESFMLWPQISPTKHLQCSLDSPPKAVLQPFTPWIWWPKWWSTTHRWEWPKWPAVLGSLTHVTLPGWQRIYTNIISRWFYCLYSGLMWKRNLLIHDCTLQHYIHIRIYISKSPVLNHFHMLQKWNQDQVIINNNNNILAPKEAIWTTLLPW